MTRFFRSFPALLSTLLLLGLASSALAAGQEVKLDDFDRFQAGFSFSQGKITRSTGGKTLPSSIDFILDLPHGIGANNAKLSKHFMGKAGIVAMGAKSLADITEAPTTGYKPALTPAEIKVGHSYCFLTADGRHYGKLQVVAFDENKRTLTFTWQYQPKDTNRF